MKTCNLCGTEQFTVYNQDIRCEICDDCLDCIQLYKETVFDDGKDKYAWEAYAN